MRPASSFIRQIDNGDEMKQSAALILALGATAAQAQTNVTIYGIVDAALVGERGGSAGSLTKITSGAASASRIGFKGEEALGNGVSAFFTLETGTKIDTGEVDAAGESLRQPSLLNACAA